MSHFYNETINQIDFWIDSPIIELENSVYIPIYCYEIGFSIGFIF